MCSFCHRPEGSNISSDKMSVLGDVFPGILPHTAKMSILMASRLLNDDFKWIQYDEVHHRLCESL